MVLVMRFFSALGCIGVLLFKCLTGVDLRLGLDDDGDEVIGTIAEMDERDEDSEEEAEGEGEEDPEVARRRREEEDRAREAEIVRRRNKGAGVETRTLFSTPHLDIN